MATWLDMERMYNLVFSTTTKTVLFDIWNFCSNVVTADDAVHVVCACPFVLYFVVFFLTTGTDTADVADFAAFEPTAENKRKT